MRYKFLTILLMAQAFVLNSCQGVDHLFKNNFWVGILIIVIIVALIVGLAIKLFGKNID
jgi:membrane protein insertase Oxa1/YidC/SpoIIIJ